MAIYGARLGRCLGLLGLFLGACNGKSNLQSEVQAPPNDGQNGVPVAQGPTGLSDSTVPSQSLCNGVSGVFTTAFVQRCQELKGVTCTQTCIDTATYSKLIAAAGATSSGTSTATPTSPKPGTTSTSGTSNTATNTTRPEFLMSCNIKSDAPCVKSQGGATVATFAAGTWHPFNKSFQTWSWAGGMFTYKVYMENSFNCWVEEKFLQNCN